MRPATALTAASGAAGLLLLAALGASWRGELTTRPSPSPPPPPSPGPELTELPSVSPEPTASVEAPTDDAVVYTIDTWVGPALLLLLAILAAVVLILVLRHLRPSEMTSYQGDLIETTTLATAAEVPDLTSSLASARSALGGSGPPRDAVVAAWVALEEGAVQLDAGRRPSQTPTEFTLDLLSRTSAEPDAVEALRQVYLAARFSTAPVTPDDVETAREALTRIEATWRG